MRRLSIVAIALVLPYLLQSAPITTTVESGAATGVATPIESNRVLTCAHVIKDENNISVNSYEANIEYINYESDIAVLNTLYTFKSTYSIGDSLIPWGLHKEVLPGDSGYPIIKNGKIVGMLKGVNSNNEKVYVRW